MNNLFYGIWSAVGIVVLVLLSIAVFGPGTWSENLNLAETPQSSEQDVQGQQQQQQTQPQQETVEPTQEQLDCIAQELGDERFAELQQGEPAQSQQEQLVIQQCLQG